MDLINRALENAAVLYNQIASSLDIKQGILKSSVLISNALNSGNRVFFCGNGGSAADAQHLAAELSGRFYLDRKALPSEALHVNTSFVTAVSNDYGYENIFARAIEAQASAGDILILLTTSGSSKNIIKAAEKASEMNLVSIAMTGKAKSRLSDLCELTIAIPSTDTPRIQEGHMLVGHTICELVEHNLFSDVQK